MSAALNILCELIFYQHLSPKASSPLLHPISNPEIVHRAGTGNLQRLHRTAFCLDLQLFLTSLHLKPHYFIFIL